MPLFRGFTERWHAEDFLHGRIRISSLHAWRTTEDHARVDVQEGTTSLTIEDLAKARLSHQDVELLKRVGIEYPVGAENIVMRNVSGVLKTPNAPGLSFSRADGEDIRQKMGEFWIRVTHPASLFDRLSVALQSEYILRKAVAMPVLYRPRSIQQTEPDPGPAYLIKPKAFAIEQEVRFVWFTADASTVRPFTVVDVGELSDICALVD